MSEPVPQSAAPSPPPRGLRRKTRFILLGILVAPILIFTLYTVTALSVDYSEGERAGILQKFSRKGWVCKTYEGELAMTTVPGVAPVIWEFSVREDAVAEGLRRAIGKPVALHYREHRGVPTKCFGETRYFVDGVIIR
ncbi:MAG TPA: hypothetical protein VFO06_07570 [Gemmatimonadales bacterium]|nr:hypothetical protein [Gemmatimonadales bacterium]